MQAVLIEEHGGREQLRLREVDEPGVPADSVLVRVRACAVNFLDVWARRGLPGVNIPLPLIPGNDIAGVVEKTGSLVTWLEPGDEVVVAPGVGCGHCQPCHDGDDNLCRRYQVIGYGRNGGHAEYAIVPAANCIAKPAALTWAETAAIPLVFLTAWHMLVHRARVRPGEDVLVLAAGSGIGSAAIQVARLHGARVLAAASTDAKLERARELGANELINYRDKDFAAEVRRLTAKKGVEIVFEHTGQDTWERSVLSVAKNGRIVTCGNTSGYEGRTDLRHVFARQIQILGSYMGRRAEVSEVFRWVEMGRLRPVVHQVLPLADVAEAHRILEDREAFGKVVLEP
jgi:NADPH:quinone reductase-like Zn-dependent oxidoreductase